MVSLGGPLHDKQNNCIRAVLLHAKRMAKADSAALFLKHEVRGLRLWSKEATCVMCTIYYALVLPFTACKQCAHPLRALITALMYTALPFGATTALVCS